MEFMKAGPVLKCAAIFKVLQLKPEHCMHCTFKHILIERKTHI